MSILYKKNRAIKRIMRTKFRPPYRPALRQEHAVTEAAAYPLTLSADIPKSYNDTYVRAIPRDPGTTFVYWEMPKTEAAQNDMPTSGAAHISSGEAKTLEQKIRPWNNHHVNNHHVNNNGNDKNQQNGRQRFNFQNNSWYWETGGDESNAHQQHYHHGNNNDSRRDGDQYNGNDRQYDHGGDCNIDGCQTYAISPNAPPSTSTGGTYSEAFRAGTVEAKIDSAGTARAKCHPPPLCMADGLIIPHLSSGVLYNLNMERRPQI